MQNSKLIEEILKIEKRHRSAKLSRKRWLKKLNIAESTWYRWMSGKTTPRWETLQILQGKA